MFGCLPLDGPHREGGLLPGLRTYLPLSRTTLTQQFLVPRLKISTTMSSGIANSARHHRFDDFGACYPECTPIGKPSLRAKRKIAAWDDDFLASLMVA
jgi:hypothetical protein